MTQFKNYTPHAIVQHVGTIFPTLGVPGFAR